MLYCALVRPVLEYASIVRCPSAARPLARLESIQRKFARFALRSWSVQLDYDGHCALLGIETLKQRNCNAARLFVAGRFDNQIDSPAILSKLNMYIDEIASTWIATRREGTLHSLWLI